MQRRIVGQERVLDEILMALIAGGHALLVGVPGLAKTLMVRSVAEALHLEFRRIQFTPDLVPSDITGTEILEEDSATGARSFRFVRGPIFANIVLADEINRAPPRTQAALLEAMQEHSVTASGETMPLPEPFFVLATQNPIEQEGTYPLPEAQLDRFLFDIRVGYPGGRRRGRDPARPPPAQRTRRSQPILGAAELHRAAALVRDVAAGRPSCCATRRRSCARRVRTTSAPRSSCANTCAGAPVRARGSRSSSAPRPIRATPAGSQMAVGGVVPRANR